MAGTVGAKRLTEADKAQILATLAANDGNVKRTARDLGLTAPTVRRYRDKAVHGEGPAQELVIAAVGDFVEKAETIRNKAMILLEARIMLGEIKASELITTIGVLDDKIRLAKNLPTSKVEHTSALPDAVALREALGPIVQGAIEAAGRRHDEIVDAEIVEATELPPVRLLAVQHS